MRESTKFALTLGSLALLVAGTLAITLVKTTHDVGRVMAFGLNPSAAVAKQGVDRTNKHDRLVPGTLAVRTFTPSGIEEDADAALHEELSSPPVATTVVAKN